MHDRKHFLKRKNTNSNRNWQCEFEFEMKRLTSKHIKMLFHDNS